MGLLPTSKQIDFLNWELGVFFHYGIRTYNEMTDKSKGKMNPATFNPTNLDCEQWIRIIKKAGAKYAVLTAKHHDGFALWQSDCSDYSVKQSPWKNGRGDVVKEFTDACRKYDIKVGIYLNPSQWTMDKFTEDEYNDYVVNQIRELLSGYGIIDYIWFDGAGSETHEYDKERIVDTIRTLQPGILIFNMWDPDTRWIGNEMGIAPMSNKNIVNSVSISIYTEKQDLLDGKMFLPGECDTMMTDTLGNWFYNKSARLRSLDELMGMYLYTVGRGSNLLINISPDKEGKICAEYEKAFLDFGEAIKNLTQNPILHNENIIYNKNEYILTLNKPTLINTVILGEDYSEEEIECFEIYVGPDYGNDFQKVFIGETVGHKRICQFPPFWCERIKIVTDEKSDTHKLKDIMLNYTKLSY